MDKLDMRTDNIADKNFEKLSKMFPNAVTETINEDGEVVRAIDADVLRQEISCSVVEGKDERYQFTWPGKKKSTLFANESTSNTLRLIRDKSLGKTGIRGDLDSENIYIEGDNIEVLKLLQETYLGKIKMIYLDPPYNTGSDAFVYDDDMTISEDDFSLQSGQKDEDNNLIYDIRVNNENNGRFHTDWLNMIYPRIRLAKNLLTEDGVIAISIDDHELKSMVSICNEIFGELNKIAILVLKNNSAKNQSKFFGVTTEYCILYAKNTSFLSSCTAGWRIKKKGAADINRYFLKRKGEGIPIDQIGEEIKELYSRPKYSHLSRWNKIDEKGVFKDENLSRANGPKDFTIINPNTGKPCVIPPRGWGKSKEELERLQKEDMIWYGDENTPPGFKSYLRDDSLSVPDNYFFVDTSTDKKYLDKCLGNDVFPFPKSVSFIQTLIDIITDENDIILDLFSGSATTAHAVMNLNADGKGKRKYILVQVPEKTKENGIAYKKGYKNICDIGEKRIYDTCESLKQDSVNESDLGVRVFKVDSSNMKDVYYTPAETQQTLFDTYSDNIKEDRTPEDLLFQVMLDLGVLLSSKIEETEIAEKKVYNVSDGFLIACFDKDVTEETVKAVAEKKPYYAVFRDSSMGNDSVATNFDQIFESMSPDTIRKVL